MGHGLEMVVLDHSEREDRQPGEEYGRVGELRLQREGKRGSGGVRQQERRSSRGAPVAWPVVRGDVGWWRRREEIVGCTPKRGRRRLIWGAAVRDEED